MASSLSIGEAVCGRLSRTALLADSNRVLLCIQKVRQGKRNVETDTYIEPEVLVEVV
jgi:hypothetical protein